MLYLPPYLLDLNPIEEAFAKVKALLQRAAAGGHEPCRDEGRGSRRFNRPGRSPLVRFVRLHQSIGKGSMEFVLQF